MVKHRRKMRVSWSVNSDVLELLKQAKLVHPRKISITALVEYAVRKTYKNRQECIRDQMSQLQQKLMFLQDQLNTLEDLQEAKIKPENASESEDDMK